MNSSHSPARRLYFWPLLSLLAAALPAHAFSLTATSPIALTCGTTTGPGTAASVVVKPAAALVSPNTIAVTYGSVGAGLVITAPATPTLTATNAAAGITYTVNIAAGCVGATTGTRTFQFSAGGVADVTVTANVTVTGANAASPLTALPTAVTFFCTRIPAVGSGSVTYVPGPAQVLAIRSATPGGTPFTVNNTSAAPPTWLTLSSVSGGTATATPVNVTLGVVAGCGALNPGSVNNGTIHLTNSPANDKVISVTLRIVPPSPLVATPSPATISYVKGSGTPGKVDINITSLATPAPFFSVDTSSLPIWLNVDSTSGSTPKSLRFVTTSAADALAPGTYSGSVHLQVSNSADLVLPVTLQLNNPAPKLTIAEGLTRTISWAIGTPLPNPYITAVSSDSPIPYTVTTGGALAPIVSAANMKDLAYNIGTPIPITFDPNVFAAAIPGSTLSGTVSLTWGNPSTTTTVTLLVTVAARGAVLSSITPASLPTAAPGQTFTLVLSGSNFVPGTDPNVRTTVGIVGTSTFVVDPSITVNVANASSIILTIVVSNPSPNMPFAPSGTGGTVVLGVCNPSGAPCSAATSTVSFTIGGGPLVQAVTNSASYLQVTAPTVQTIAPYDLISVFGSSFCSSHGTGCASTDVLRVPPDPTTLSYQTWLSPDALSGTQRQLTAVFQTHATPPVVIATAPLLFATNSQINMVVPAALSTYSPGAVDLVVNFGYGTGATMLSSAPFPVNIADNDPGVFTVTGDGQGLGAILGASTLSPVGPGMEAGLRSTAADSDTVQIFMTGLGIPNSTADNSAAGSSGAYSADCISTQTYLDSLNLYAGTAITSMDGLVVSSALLNTNRRVPCFLTASALKPTVTIGGVAATVTYAGWVPDSVAGQYEVDVRLPGSTSAFTTSSGVSLSAITTPVQLPVVVTTGGHTSQAGVTMWATRKPKVTGPSGAGLTGPVGVAWSASNNVIAATEGTAPYRYAVTSGLLPAGLLLNAATGAISGTPAANTSGTYQVTVTATDSANFPISDSVSFTLTVTGGLVLTNTGVAPFHEVFSVADATMTTIAATGGTYPYVYSLTSPSPLPAGLSIDTASGVISMDATVPAGTYHVTVQAVDSTTLLQGSTTFDLIVALKLADTAPAAGTHGSASTITTISSTGQTGAVTYALDSTSAALSWLALDSSTGIITITTGAPSGISQSVTVTGTAATAASGAASAGVGTLTFSLVVN